MLAPGTLLSDRYRLTERIAAGGMGEVWRGTDLLLHRAVAVKVLLPALTSDREFITRFRTEARMMAALRHPGVVQVYDYGSNAPVDYLVMEYIEGTPLSRRIADAGRLTVAETMTVVAQVADALQVAHQAGIVHRDVKPGNLLVRPGGALVLVDFGVARNTTVAGLTGTNVVLGSAHYMAPEQAEGRPVTPATDVYAVGGVAYCCLTGRPPYEGDNPLAVMTQLVYGDLPSLPPDVPPAVAAVVLRALAKDPAQRFPSAAAMAQAAREAARSATTTRPSVSGVFTVPPTMRAPGGSASGAYTGRQGPGARTGGQRPIAAQGGARPPASAFSQGRASASVQPPSFSASAAGPGFSSGAAAVPSGGRTSGSGPADSPFAPPSRGRRRGSVVLAVAAGALVLALGGTAAAVMFPTGSGEGQPPPQDGGITVTDEPTPDAPARTTTGKAPKPSRTAPPSRRPRSSAPAAPAPSASPEPEDSASPEPTGTGTLPSTRKPSADPPPR